jgi:hypothetical protein
LNQRFLRFKAWNSATAPGGGFFMTGTGKNCALVTCQDSGGSVYGELTMTDFTPWLALKQEVYDKPKDSEPREWHAPEAGKPRWLRVIKGRYWIYIQGPQGWMQIELSAGDSILFLNFKMTTTPPHQRWGHWGHWSHPCREQGATIEVCTLPTVPTPEEVGFVRAAA